MKFVSLVLLVSLAVVSKGEDVLVTVDQGTLRGSTSTSVYNSHYTAFLGIPYAEPPLGALRFQAPRPAGRWEGVLDATRYGSACVQEGGAGAEDCLFLNVFVPGRPQEGARLPAMLWIHGGGFTVGSGSDEEYGPDFLVSQGVILVTINYRLGPLGFLSTGDEIVPGNAGVKDQQLAMSWVQKNIASFGGDPRQVTVFGQSAGGISVSFHLVSPTSAGLFTRLIIESGVFIRRLVPLDSARNHAFRLGAALGCETNDSRQLVDFLRSVSSSDLLVNRALILTDEEKKLVVSGLWEPHVEPNIEGAFIAESPIIILNEGRFSQVPIMIGTTSAEFGPYMVNQQDLIANLNEAFDVAVGPCLHLPTTAEQAEAAWKLRGFYFGNDTISSNEPGPIVNFMNDISIFATTDDLVRKVTELSNFPVYYYEFNYGQSPYQSEWGVLHSGEMPFLFLRKDTEYNLDPESEEERVRRNMLLLWTNFAKYGNPTPAAEPMAWEPYNLTSRSYMLMQANFSLAHDKLAERMDFWHQNVPLLPFPDTRHYS